MNYNCEHCGREDLEESGVSVNLSEVLLFSGEKRTLCLACKTYLGGQARKRDIESSALYKRLRGERVVVTKNVTELKLSVNDIAWLHRMNIKW